MKTPSDRYSVSICISKCNEENFNTLIEFLNSEMGKAINAAELSDHVKIDSGAINANTTTNPITYGGQVVIQFFSDKPLQVTKKILEAVPSAEINFG